MAKHVRQLFVFFLYDFVSLATSSSTQGLLLVMFRETCGTSIYNVQGKHRTPIYTPSPALIFIILINSIDIYHFQLKYTSFLSWFDNSFTII